MRGVQGRRVLACDRETLLSRDWSAGGFDRGGLCTALAGHVREVCGSVPGAQPVRARQVRGAWVGRRKVCSAGAFSEGSHLAGAGCERRWASAVLRKAVAGEGHRRPAASHAETPADAVDGGGRRTTARRVTESGKFLRFVQR